MSFLAPVGLRQGDPSYQVSMSYRATLSFENPTSPLQGLRPRIPDTQKADKRQDHSSRGLRQKPCYHDLKEKNLLRGAAGACHRSFPGSTEWSGGRSLSMTAQAQRYSRSPENTKPISIREPT
jgi:hypothetical protein